ncbi:type IV pilin-like G/H family protein [Floridanema evergladense]|uniref:Type IV pilin-like G/H family protein n=1 Tax=Floridaenema evergladense BLCC-F167 TaxID=3153639 RepID=A0ABV4WMW4_9CYAN
MTQANIMELAKQGDTKALSALWCRQLQPKGIVVKTNIASGCLTVIGESKEAPEQVYLVDFIRKSLSNLKLETIKKVIVQGRATGSATPAWREPFDVPPAGIPATEPPALNGNGSNVKSPKVSFTTPTNELKKNKFTSIVSVLKGTKELVNTGLLLGILLVLTANLFANSKSQPILWEYKVDSIEDSLFELTMLRMGGEGWELASARRAVSGEGYSSRGLYEVIFKRPATKAQIQESQKQLEAALKESKIRSKQISAEVRIDSINRAQQANYTEKNTFANSLEELEVTTTGDDYTYNLTADGEKSLITATATIDELKSYTGAVFLVEQNGETTTVRVNCETDAPSKIPPEAPQLNGSELTCPTGSSKVD